MLGIFGKKKDKKEVVFFFFYVYEFDVYSPYSQLWLAQ